jgi:predicted DNA-binding transcriptional regulator YafY
MGLGNAASRARNKLLAALPKSGSDEASRIAGRFHLDTTDWYRVARPTPFLARIARAVLDQKKVAITYNSWRAQRGWSLEPYGLVLKAANWYLIARGHGKVRIFNIADVQSLDLLDSSFDRPTNFDLPRWWVNEQLRFEAELFSETARLRVSPAGLKRLATLSPRGAEAARTARPDQEGWTLVEMKIENSDHGARELLTMGAELSILSPLTLRKRLYALAQGVAAMNREESSS